MSTGPWHHWFAWHPVRTEQHGWRWLRTVERRQIGGPTLTPYEEPSLWQYRPTTINRHETEKQCPE